MTSTLPAGSQLVEDGPAPGQVLANGVILALNATRELTVVAGGGNAHFVIDVNGYWL